MNFTNLTHNKPVISYDRFSGITSLSIRENDYKGIKTWYFKGDHAGYLWSSLYNGAKQSRQNGATNYRLSNFIPQDLLHNKEYVGLRKIKINDLLPGKHSIEIDSIELSDNHNQMHNYYQAFDELVRMYNNEPDILKLTINKELLQTAHSQGFLKYISKYKDNREFSATKENDQVLLEKPELKLAELKHKNNIQDVSTIRTERLIDINEARKKHRNQNPFSRAA